MNVFKVIRASDEFLDLTPSSFEKRTERKWPFYQEVKTLRAMPRL